MCHAHTTEDPLWKLRILYLHQSSAQKPPHELCLAGAWASFVANPQAFPTYAGHGREQTSALQIRTSQLAPRLAR